MFTLIYYLPQASNLLKKRRPIKINKSDLID